MKKFFTIVAAALMSVALFADEESKVTKVGFHFPEAGQPGDANIEMGGTFAEGKMMMEKVVATGWFLSYDFVNAKEDDTFKFYDKTNPKLTLCKLIPSNGEGEGKWVQAIFKFGNYWSDDTWKGTPCKLIEMDINEDANFAWKEDAPVADTLQLELVASDPEMGTVVVTNLLGSDIVDKGEGKYSVPEDVEVAIFATPKEGYKFAGWYEGEEGSTADCECWAAVNTAANPWKRYLTKNVAVLAHFVAKEEAIDNTTVEAKSVKVVRDGMLLIERDGKLFDVTGAEVK